MLSVCEAFAQYRKRFKKRKPDLGRMRNEDELLPADDADGKQYFRIAPARCIETGRPPKSEKETWDPSSECLRKKYIWVVMENDIPYIMEYGAKAFKLSGKRFTHTNLTGGQAAHCGGEIWFADSCSFWMSGGSGRYRPRSAEELEQISLAFENLGYKVSSFGWDEESGEPFRFFREKVG